MNIPKTKCLIAMVGITLRRCILAENFSKLSCNHGNYHLVIMHRLHNHVYFVMSCLLWSYWSKCTLLGKYRVVNLHISPAITFHQVSPNPMAVPKSILLHLKRRPQRTFSQKLIWIKTTFFEKPKVKVHWWWPLTRPLWDILDNYTKWKRMLRVTSGENCRSKG